MNKIELKAGDVLLLPAEEGPMYKWFEKILGKSFTIFVSNLLGHRYIHAEMYIGAGWILAAWMNGVKLLKAQPWYVDRFDIFRHPKIEDKHRRWIEKIFQKYWNMPYDYISLAENTLIEVASVGTEPIEVYLEDKMLYQNPSAMICSELIARIFEDIGLKIERNSEFVTPDDLAEKLQKII